MAGGGAAGESQRERQHLPICCFFFFYFPNISVYVGAPVHAGDQGERRGMHAARA